MFVPSTLHHQSCRKTCHSYLPDTFSLLCWNIHKNNKKAHFQKYLQKEVTKKKLDLLIFQEAVFRHKEPLFLPEFSYDAAANLEVNGKFYGVLTASRAQSLYATAHLSKGQEVFIGSHKSMLLSSYQFSDKSKLLVLNVHVINFRENDHYNRELERFFDFIESYEGMLIIAGDFNSWNIKRREELFKKAHSLNLKAVTFGSHNHVKSFMGNTLDFIFYKGLELLNASVEKAEEHSDHNPLCAKFKKS